MRLKEVLGKLKSLTSVKAVAGMARFGINPRNTLGVSMPMIREIAKEIGSNHKLAQQLWDSKIHEARILAGFVAEEKETTEEQMENWVKDFDSWDVCDQVCGNLFDKTEFAYNKAFEWSKRKEEFIKRAGFVLMATLSVHDKKASDKQFEQFLPVIKREAEDARIATQKLTEMIEQKKAEEELKANHEKLRALTTKLTVVEHMERRRIARALHDQIG